MAVYTDISSEILSEWGTQLGVDRITDITPAAKGIQNSNWFVNTILQSGEPQAFVVTVVETLSKDKVEQYFSIFAQLAKSGVPIPAPLPATNPKVFYIEDKAAAWFPLFPGDHCLNPQEEHLSQIGESLGTLHTQASTIDQGDFLPSLITLAPQSWMSQEEQIWLQAKLTILQPYYSTWNSLPSGVIHSDLFRDNVLFENDQLSAVLDWYDIKQGPYLCDLAITLNDWCHIPSGTFNTIHQDAFLDAYNKNRHLAPQEQELLTLAQIDAAVRFWYSRTHQQWLINNENPNLIGHSPEPMKRLANDLEALHARRH